MGILLLTSFTFQDAVAAEERPERCGFFEISDHCDISGILHLIIGDMIIGSMLGGAFYLFTERNNKNLKKIIKEDLDMNNLRRDYAVRNMKNSINTLIFISGHVQKLTKLYNKEGYNSKDMTKLKIAAEEERLQRFLQSARNGLIYSSDVFDPTIMYEIEGLCTFMGQMSTNKVNGKIDFPKFAEAKNKMDIISRKLSTYRNVTHEFQLYAEEEEFETLKD